MGEEVVPARGERAAIGGYLPQFDEFAWFVYVNLINKELEWIRVADPNAEKLDDIQYSTHSEIHAYQVKWTIAEATISYNDFISLFPSIVSSWKSIKQNNQSKKIFAHLITNKPVSCHDIIIRDIKIGSFYDFMSEVWNKLKSKQDINPKWLPIIEELKKISTLNDFEFADFFNIFDFQPAYQKKDFSVENIKYSKEDEDLQQISRFIMEQVASPERIVEFSRQEIIQKLGWTERFKTNFNHELVVDRRKYQPIQSTIDLLNSKLAEHENGYIFLQGGPGTGKSTLLNQWSKQIKRRVVRYYAFDFVNPSSHLNFYERGNATYLFFDLVFQLKEAGIYKRNILPYKDILFLKEVFAEQLKSLGEEYAETGQSTIIIIDGLDHVPREYQSVTNSFLRELPFPSSLPKGVFIILGSQTYELEDLHQEIIAEFKKGNRTLQIDPLKKEEVYKYIDTIDIFSQLAAHHKQLIYEKSQGHPLYLSYLIEKIIESNSIDEVIDSFETINGDIENYYKRIWIPIAKEEELVQLLGLISRIKGSVNIDFINEWGFKRDVLKLFRDKAKVLFNENEKNLSFFHNSYRQFLLYHTAINYLTDNFDSEIELNYHNQLAFFYSKSTIEKIWKQNYHLFQAKKYNEFLGLVTPDSFTEQLLDYRPVEEIKQDAKLGIEIAKQIKSIHLLIRYLFALAEIERRLFNVDPASFTEELLILKNFDAASRYLRTGNILHCNKSYAYKASHLFLKYDYVSEATALYNLAYPDVITNDGINIDDSHRYEEIKEELEAWIYIASYFEATENILDKIKKISFSKEIKENKFYEKESDLYVSLLIDLEYSLIDQNKWSDFDYVFKIIDTITHREKKIFFELHQYAIEQCLDLNDTNRALDYLSQIKKHFTQGNIGKIGKIHIADLIYKVTENKDDTFNWIKEIKQPLNIDISHFDYDASLDIFSPLIILNRLLNICGKGISITSAVPDAKEGSDEEILVEFQRMLCLITQIQTDLKPYSILTKDITKRVSPMVRYYYKNVSPRNKYWYKLTKCKDEYFEFLIHSVSLLGIEALSNLGQFIFDEFTKNSQYWETTIRRKIILSLFNNGLAIANIKCQLLALEDAVILEGRDIDGRITECLAHSKAWLNLGEHYKAEKWLRQAIQESIGVGYRKDYQFSTWINWLRIVNKVDPENAPDRIKWFLSHLKHIKETTEGQAYWHASENLLEATYEYNLYDGFQQTIWQLDHDLIDFNDSISLFIKYFIKRVQNEEDFTFIIQLYNDLYLLLPEDGNRSLLKSILVKGYEIFNEYFLYNHIGDIITAITIKAHEDSRYYLLNEIDEFFLSKNIRAIDYYPEFKILTEIKRSSSSENSNNLDLTNQNKMSEDDLIEKCTNFEEFKRFFQKRVHDALFKWSEILDKITPALSVSQIEEIGNMDKKGRIGSDFYARLSKAALEKDAVQLAKQLAEKSLELSSESGWVTQYDGGTRIEAFKALRNIDPKKYSEKAFEVFAYDIVSSSYPSSYIEEIKEIVPLLSETYDTQEIWSEIFDYLKRLMANSNPIVDLPVISSINKPIIETLIDYSMYLLNSPVSIIKEQSVLLLAKYINLNNSYALNLLLDKNIDDYKMLDIVMALSELESLKIKEFIPKIKKLSISKDYHLRSNTRQILYTIGEDIPVPKSINLPAIYSLLIPESPKPDFNKEIDPYFPEVNVNNPRDLTRIFDIHINALSNESGIDEYNLVLRIYALMKILGKENEWTNEYEKGLRYHLKEINLKYAYPRPRVIAAQKALMHVVAELIDSRTIYEGTINRLFQLYDYSVPYFKEIAKPSFIQRIQERESGGISSDWINRINECSRLTEPLLDYKHNFKIIAEYTCIKNLDWGTLTEEYMWQIAINDKINKKNHYVYDSLFHQLSNNYHHLNKGGHSIIMIRDHRFNQFDLKSRWIAINPVLARHLYWEPDYTKLFAWKDSNGELMAESIYWLNGNINIVSRKDGEVGEGWFVVVSECALEQIKSIEKKLFIHKKLIRSKTEDSIPIENQIFNIVKI